MNKNQNIKLSEKGGNCEPCEMVAIPLLETSFGNKNLTNMADLVHSNFTKHILVPADIVNDPKNTFAFKTDSDSMEPILYENDYLIADSSQIVCSTKAMNKIVIAWYDDSFTVKWLREDGKDLYLVPENIEKSKPLLITHNSNFHIAGVVTYRISYESIKDIVARTKK